MYLPVTVPPLAAAATGAAIARPTAERRRMARTLLRATAAVGVAAGGRDVCEEHDTAHLMGGCPMGSDPRTSVTSADGKTWEIPNLWICDGSLMPTGGGVNPSGTIMALACRIGDGIVAQARRRELDRPAAAGRTGNGEMEERHHATR